MAVNYLDRVCSRVHVHVRNYQLIGAACFLIASKICECEAVSKNSLVNLGMGSFTESVLLVKIIFILAYGTGTFKSIAVEFKLS